MRPSRRHGFDELRAFFINFVNDGEFDRIPFLFQLVGQARITFRFQFGPEFIAPFQNKPAMRFDLKYFAAVGYQVARRFDAP